MTAEPLIPFNRPPATGTEAESMAQAIANLHLSADGPFTESCREWMQQKTGVPAVLLVHSCTAALEMAALLLDVGPGDEVIMPSYTFVSTANAFVLRGATPVFVDVVDRSYNIDPNRIEAAIGPKTRAVVPVHYAGVGCDMDEINAVCAERDIAVIEDAAQGLMATYRGRALGAMGSMSGVSFHETKNVTCGEGGALLVNDLSVLDRAEIVREKGTNRSRFYRGQVDKYTWVDLGSSHALSDLAAAFLWSQLQSASEITERRLAIWDAYDSALEALDARGVERPQVPQHCNHNAHMYFLTLPTHVSRDAFIAGLWEANVQSVFHYVPLHDSPGGIRFGRADGEMPNTLKAGERLVRLPLWPEMSGQEVERVIDSTIRVVERLDARPPDRTASSSFVP